MPDPKNYPPGFTYYSPPRPPQKPSPTCAVNANEESVEIGNYESVRAEGLPRRQYVRLEGYEDSSYTQRYRLVFHDVIEGPNPRYGDLMRAYEDALPKYEAALAEWTPLKARWDAEAAEQQKAARRQMYENLKKEFGD